MYALQNRLSEMKVIINHLNGFKAEPSSSQSQLALAMMANRPSIQDNEEDSEQENDVTTHINKLLNSSPTRRIIDKLQPKQSVETTDVLAIVAAQNPRHDFECETEEDKEQLIEYEKKYDDHLFDFLLVKQRLKHYKVKLFFHIFFCHSCEKT